MSSYYIDSDDSAHELCDRVEHLHQRQISGPFLHDGQ